VVLLRSSNSNGIDEANAVQFHYRIDGYPKSRVVLLKKKYTLRVLFFIPIIIAKKGKAILNN
jgi:pyridoxine/pyridoxamine 5'-phosphate oxidase